jgi:hypothetical protein
VDTLTPRNEIADIEWRRVTSLAWPILAVISIIQALFSSLPVQGWQVTYCLGLLLVLLISKSLAIHNVVTFADVPTVIYLLVAPFVVGDQAKAPWISLGLVVFAAVIYFSTIENIYLALVLVVSLCIFQSYAASLNLASFTDSKDLSLFYSYFSFVWTAVIGIASIYIRRRYMRVAQSIEFKVEDEIEKSIRRISSLKQVNLKDSRNIRLHGTILNSFIYARNLISEKKSISEVVPRLVDEIDTLASELKGKNTVDLRTAISEMVGSRSLNRIVVNVQGADAEEVTPQIRESIVEIIREYILNSEKHTLATEISVKITQDSSGVLIEFTDNALKDYSTSQSRAFVNYPLQSETLGVLLTECGARAEAALNQNSRIRKISVRIPIIDLEEELATTISTARILGLNDFVFNFLRAGALVMVLSIPAYFYVGSPVITVCVLFVMTIAFILALQVKPYGSLILLTVISASLIIPSMSLDPKTCGDLSTVPWLFNHILTVGYFVAVVVKQNSLKWLPIAILGIESIIYPLTYPTECRSILLGSIPAIPLITVMAIAVLGVRRRELNYDRSSSTEIARLARITTEADKYQEAEIEKLIMGASSFIGSLSNLPTSELTTASLNLEIQKIQSYLVCAEHFDSALIRGCYEIFRDSLSAGIPGKLSFMGANLRNIDSGIEIEKLLNFISTEKGSLPLNLTIVNIDSLELHFDGYPENHHIDKAEQRVAGLTVFKNL